MNEHQEFESRPAQPAPAGEGKEPLAAVIGYAEGRTYVIPIEVARPFESGAPMCATDADVEVGGRHAMHLQRWGYHTNWLIGPYVWITDGRSYRGPHWHPNVNSPLAYDMDNY